MLHGPGAAASSDPFHNILEQAVGGTLDVDLSRDLDPGEKAEDAIDFEDLSDTDLAVDEGQSKGAEQRQAKEKDVPSNDILQGNRAFDPSFEVVHDDLFDEGSFHDEDTNPLTENNFAANLDYNLGTPDGFDHAKRHGLIGSQPSKEEQLQRQLFARSLASVAAENQFPEPPESSEELLKILWPKFHRDAVPRFTELLPPNKARYMTRRIQKVPRILQPSKLSLDIAVDHERSFKTSTDAFKTSSSNTAVPGVVKIAAAEDSGQKSDQDSCEEIEYNENPERKSSYIDMQILCEDWDLSNESDCSVAAEMKRSQPLHGTEWWARTSMFNQEYRLENSWLGFPSTFDEPEKDTNRLAKKIKLDLNDPCLLVDGFREQEFAHQCVLSSSQVKSFLRQYNISNDNEYDLLKENHQNKIRSMLGNLHIEHSMPARRLQWPFYKTRLEKQAARSFHRPFLSHIVQEQTAFTKPASLKRKAVKGKDARVLFAQSSDLALNDNSNALLLEYSEEHPMVLSNVGMGSKIINHYRKRFAQDPSRPKMDIGELNPLLPNDKSPFSLFGFVDPGSVVSAVQNTMYQAPVFKHESRATDFLMIKTSTGVEGNRWFLRGIENLFVVGQEFPVAEIPGPNSRKVSTASKNRLKMIAYRIARRNKNNRISVSAVTRHFPDTNDVQNRQKMKDFMQHDKVEKEWKPKPGESIPDEELIREMVKPEEVCLLESMQAGEQHLLDAGVVKLGEEAGVETDSHDNDHIETKLAPWFASKNFLLSAQNKAMLQLHGEGDPTGRGEAISMVKTSMKGGFKSQGLSVSERIEDKKEKEKGHTYNVERQTAAYNQSIRRIWDAQLKGLASTIENSDDDSSSEADDETRDFTAARSDANSFGLGRRLDNETASQSSRWSGSSQSAKLLEITRTEGNVVVRDIIKNPRIIRQYLRRRTAMHVGNEDVVEMKAGSDAVENKRMEQRLQVELARLNRNKDRRLARDKQKGMVVDGVKDGSGSSTLPSASQMKSGATQRKCANCGQTGHIKTNKKLCPLLNGQVDPDDGFNSNAFASGATT